MTSTLLWDVCVCVSSISPPAPNYTGITSPFNDDLLSLVVKTVVLGSPGDWLLSWLYVHVCMCLVYAQHASRIIALSNLGCKRAARAPGVPGILQDMRGLCLLCSPIWGAWSLGTHCCDPGSHPSGWPGPLPLEQSGEKLSGTRGHLVPSGASTHIHTHTQSFSDTLIHFWL